MVHYGWALLYLFWIKLYHICHYIGLSVPTWIKWHEFFSVSTRSATDNPRFGESSYQVVKTWQASSVDFSINVHPIYF